MFEFALAAAGIAAKWTTAHWFFRGSSEETPAWLESRPAAATREDIEAVIEEAFPVAKTEDEFAEEEEPDVCPRCEADAEEFEGTQSRTSGASNSNVERCPTPSRGASTQRAA